MAPLHTYRKSPWNHMDEKVESEAIDVFAIGGARLDTSVMQLPKLPALLHSVSALFNKKTRSAPGRNHLRRSVILIFTLFPVASSPVPIFSLRRSEPVHQSATQNLSNMWRSTFEISATQLCFVTELALKSPFLCVNRNPIRFDFHGGTKAIR